jgi:hypothetical protein
MRIYKDNGEIVTMTTEEFERLAQESISKKSQISFITDWINRYIDIKHQWIIPVMLVLAIITIIFPKPITKGIEVVHHKEMVTFKDGNWHFGK